MSEPMNAGRGGAPPPETRRPPRRRFGPLAKLVAVLMSTLLALLLAEVVVRFLGLAPAVKPLGLAETATVYKRSSNPMLGFELKASYRDEDADSRSSYTFTNAHGQRDIERTLEKPPGATRVILLGDSVVEGHGIPEIDDTISRQLEGLDPDGTTEVLNFGVSAYCTRAEVELLEVKGLQFEPDVVILMFVENDFDNFNAETWELGSAGERPAIVRHLFHGSDLFRLLCVRLNLFGFGVETDPVGWNTKAIGDNNVVEGLARLRQLADTHGFEPIIAIWPRFEDDGITDVHFMPGSIEELVIERLARMHDLPTVRLSEHFDRHWHAAGARRVNPRLRYSDGDRMHPSVEGCRIAARSLRSILDADPATLAPTGGDQPRVDDPEAIDAARARGTADPGYSLVANTRGSALLAEGRLDEAIEHFRRALEDDPDFAEAHTNLGAALAAQGKTEDAIECYRRAIEIRPDLVGAHCNLGNALATQGRIPEAIEHYRTAARIQPDHVETQNNWGKALSTQGDGEEAIARYRAALRIDPDHAAAHFNLGKALAAGGHPDEAIDHYRAALRARPDSPEAETNLGRLLAMRGETEQAVAHFRRALEIDPDYVAAHNNLGGASMTLGRLDESIGHYRRALALRPDYVTAHYNLGSVLALAGRRNDALAEFREADRLRPDWPPALRRIAWILATRPDSSASDHAEALRRATRAAELAGRADATVLDTLAAAQAATGRFADAVATAETALASARDETQAAAIRTRLELYRQERPYHEPVD